MKAARGEDRRSCHNVSLVLGLAVAAKHAAIAEQAWAIMLQLCTPVAGQKAN